MDPLVFRTRRIALGLGQSDLGALLGVNQAVVSRWESGQRTIPAGVIDELGQIEEQVANMIDAMLETVEFHEIFEGEQRWTAAIYATDEELWAAEPEFFGVSSALHRHAMALAAMTEGAGLDLIRG